MHAFLPAATAKLGENAVKDISDKYPHDFADVYQYSTMPADPLYQKRIHRDDWGCFCVNTNPQRSESWNAGSEPTTSNMQDSRSTESAQAREGVRMRKTIHVNAYRLVIDTNYKCSPTSYLALITGRCDLRRTLRKKCYERE